MQQAGAELPPGEKLCDVCGVVLEEPVLACANCDSPQCLEHITAGMHMDLRETSATRNQPCPGYQAPPARTKKDPAAAPSPSLTDLNADGGSLLMGGPAARKPLPAGSNAPGTVLAPSLGDRMGFAAEQKGRRRVPTPKEVGSTLYPVVAAAMVPGSLGVDDAPPPAQQTANTAPPASFPGFNLGTLIQQLAGVTSTQQQQLLLSALQGGVPHDSTSPAVGTGATVEGTLDQIAPAILPAPPPPPPPTFTFVLCKQPAPLGELKLVTADTCQCNDVSEFM